MFIIFVGNVILFIKSYEITKRRSLVFSFWPESGNFLKGFEIFPLIVFQGNLLIN